jgi:FKBP-type peptidyl-prolyl cis-trans isomerase
MSRSGIQVLEEQEGKGEEARRGSIVTYNLRAYLNQGDEIAVNVGNCPEHLTSRDDKGVLFNFTCQIGKRNAFPAVEKALLGMRAGGYRKVKSPPQLAYGVEGVPNVVPKNALVVFEIWLKEVHILHPAITCDSSKV